MNGLILKVKMRLPAILMLIATVLFWGNYNPYKPAGPDLLNSPSIFDATLLTGDCSETNGQFILTVPSPGKTASISFRIPSAADFEMIRVGGRIKVNGVVSGKYTWSNARLLLTQYDESDVRISAHHSLKSEEGTKDWQAYEQVFELDPKVAHADIVIEHIGLAGTAEFDQLSAEPVCYKASFLWWRVLFFGLWTCMVFIFYRQCRLDSRKLRVLILLNALVILWGTMMPGKWIEQATRGVKEGIERALPVMQRSDAALMVKAGRIENKEETRVDLFRQRVKETHQLGHFILFASLCFLVYLSAALERQHRVYFLKVAFDLLLFAAIMETLQHLTLDRTPRVYDWLTDIYGMATAFVVFLVVLGIYRIYQILGKAKGRLDV